MSNLGRNSSPPGDGVGPKQISTSPGDSLSSRSFVGANSLRIDATARLALPLPSQSGSGTPPTFQNVVNSPSEPEGNPRPLAGLGVSSPTGPGSSALAVALSNSFAGSPPTFNSPPIRSTSSSTAEPADALTNYGSLDIRSRFVPGAYEDPEIIKRHLVQPSDLESESSATEDDGGAGSAGVRKPSEVSDAKRKLGDAAGTAVDDAEFSSLQLQGGDITRPIYKWTEEAEQRKVQRSQSFSVARPEPENEVLDINSIKVPGGFRRNFIRRAVKDGFAHPSDAEMGDGAQLRLFTNSFLEFLSMYGHFAGEELEEDDEALEPGEYFSSGGEGARCSDDSDSDDDRESMEDSALLTPSRRCRKRKERGGSGQNSPLGAAMLLLKSFVGTGVLFLPRAYLNGGMLFSNLVLLLVAALSYYCFVILVSTRLKVDGSFGDIGGVLYGKWMRNLILISIVISQIGFVAAYIVFTAKNLQAFIVAVTHCKFLIRIEWLITMQMLVFLPFSLLRDISKLGFTALIADAFIVIGLVYLFYYDVLNLSTHGMADIVTFNPDDWTLFIGTAIFTFEGIGLIIPIQESMKEPKKFPQVMLMVMIIITALFTVMGAVSYAAYGSKTETVVLLNLPQDDKLVNGVQFLYSLAILLSTPLQIFPAIRITENALFTKSGKYNPYIKWQKNAFRFLVVVVCALIAYCGADDLDKFVALVGNFACIPLVYIYPPMLHLRGVAKSKLWKYADIALCIIGLIAMVYTTSLTVMNWASASGAQGLTPCKMRWPQD